MITINIEEDTLYDMLMERLEFWTDRGSDVYDLFGEYYSNMVYGGCFDGMTLDINAIVDNDYVNWFSWGTREEWDDVDEDRIVAECNGLILVSV